MFFHHLISFDSTLSFSANVAKRKAAQIKSKRGLISRAYKNEPLYAHNAMPEAVRRQKN